jgi:hypothetical protein
MRTLSIVAIVMILAGCSAKYRTDALTPLPQCPDTQALVYITLPDDGRYGSKLYPGSGEQTAHALLAAVTKPLGHAVVTQAREDRAAARTKAKDIGAAYVFELTIVNWEDHATEWSGKTDKITIALSVYEVATGRDLTSTVVRASSKWGTLGGDHPQDLLPQTFERVVANLYRGRTQASIHPLTRPALGPNQLLDRSQYALPYAQPPRHRQSRSRRRRKLRDLL